MDGHDWPFPLVNECVFLVKHGGIRHISIYRQIFLKLIFLDFVAVCSKLSTVQSVETSELLVSTSDKNPSSSGGNAY